MKRELSHIATDGRVRMVNVSGKPLSVRVAIASGQIKVKSSTVDAVARSQIAKGNVFCQRANRWNPGSQANRGIDSTVSSVAAEWC